MAPTTAADARLREVEKGVKATQEGRSDVISVNFTASSPQTAAEYANLIVETFIAARTEEKTQGAEAAIAAAGRADRRAAPPGRARRCRRPPA